MFTNRTFVEQVMKSTNDPYIIAECRRMIADEKRYAENRKKKKEARARAIKNEILAYCNSVNNPFAPVLDIATATERAEQSINYYLNQLIADKELPERPKKKKDTLDRLVHKIANILEYGKMYTVYDLSKALNNQYHLTRINKALCILKYGNDPSEYSYYSDHRNNTNVITNFIESDIYRNGKKERITYWYKV